MTFSGGAVGKGGGDSRPSDVRADDAAFLHMGMFILCLLAVHIHIYIFQYIHTSYIYIYMHAFSFDAETVLQAT